MDHPFLLVFFLQPVFGLYKVNFMNQEHSLMPTGAKFAMFLPLLHFDSPFAISKQVQSRFVYSI